MAKGKIEIYKDKKGEFRWKLFASNGQQIANGGEGYSSLAGCKNGIESVKKNIQSAEIEKTYK